MQILNIFLFTRVRDWRTRSLLFVAPLLLIGVFFIPSAIAKPPQSGGGGGGPAGGGCSSYQDDRFKVCYFSGTNLSGKSLGSELEPSVPSPAPDRYQAINRIWNTGPVFKTRTDDISGVWRGNINFAPGRYMFAVEADDGFRLYVNETLIMEEWPGGHTNAAGLELNGYTNIRIEWYESTDSATLKFAWDKVATPPGPSLTSNIDVNFYILKDVSTCIIGEACFSKIFDFNSNAIYTSGWNGNWWFVGGANGTARRCNEQFSICEDLAPLLDFGTNNILTATWNGTWWLVGGANGNARRCNADLTDCTDINSGLELGSADITTATWTGTSWFIGGADGSARSCDPDLAICLDVSTALNFGGDAIYTAGWNGTYLFVGGASGKARACDGTIAACADISSIANFGANSIYTAEWDGPDLFWLLGGQNGQARKCATDFSTCTDRFDVNCGGSEFRLSGYGCTSFGTNAIRFSKRGPVWPIVGDNGKVFRCNTNLSFCFNWGVGGGTTETVYTASFNGTNWFAAAGGGVAQTCNSILERCRTTSSTCIDVRNADQTVFMSFDKVTIQGVKPSDPLVATATQNTCLHKTTSDANETRVRSEVAKVMDDLEHRWSFGNIKPTLHVFDLYGEMGMDFFSSGGWISPRNITELISPYATKTVDFSFASGEIWDTTTGRYITVPQCGSEVGADGGPSGAGYSWVPITKPARWYECSDSQTYTHELLNQMKFAMHNFMGLTTIYPPYPACTEPHDPDTYKWFPSTFDTAGKDPDGPWCGAWPSPNFPSDNTIVAAHQILDHFDFSMLHYNRLNLIGNHCEDGVQDYGETAIDEGGNCPPL